MPGPFTLLGRAKGLRCRIRPIPVLPAINCFSMHVRALRSTYVLRAFRHASAPGAVLPARAPSRTRPGTGPCRPSHRLVPTVALPGTTKAPSPVGEGAFVVAQRLKVALAVLVLPSDMVITAVSVCRPGFSADASSALAEPSLPPFRSKG